MRYLIAIFTAALLTIPAQADVLYSWTQLAPGTAQSFRAIVDDTQCPTMIVNGVQQPMSMRAGPVADFPNSVCEFTTDESVTSAELDGRRFPLRPDRADHILLVGDTGCRLKEGRPIQSCNDPVAWPFATISQSIAEKQADFAIHLGDYHYREEKCPDPGRCGQVYGDNWPTWEADFFAPATAMLEAHAFLFVRGNHESCERSWRGYLRYLATEPVRTPFMCDNYEAPFVVAFDDLQLPVIDSSTRNRDFYTWDRLRAMRRQFLAVLPQLDRETFVLTHTPLWGYGSKHIHATELGTLESIQREAFAHMLPRLVSAVISGDLHFAQIVSTPGNPVQISFGNGGVWLYTAPQGRVDGLEVGHNGVIGDTFGYDLFGFGQLDRSADGSSVTLFDPHGVAVGHCEAPVTAVSCALH